MTAGEGLKVLTDDADAADSRSSSSWSIDGTLVFGVDPNVIFVAIYIRSLY
jgi:hypothetical protein